MKLVDQAATKIDSWMNAVTGIGTVRDKLTHMRVKNRGVVLSPEALDTLYISDDLAARVVDTVPEEMFRQGYSISVEDDEGETTLALSDKLKELKADRKFILAMKWGRLQGASAIVVGADDGGLPEDPLNEAKVKSLTFLNVVERRHLTILRWYSDPFAPNFGEPELYQVTMQSPGGGGTTTQIHESRLIVFSGVDTPEQKRSLNGGFDWSVLERVHSVLQEFHTTWKSTAHLMTDVAQGVVTIKNLMSMIAGGQMQVLMDRIELMNMARSVSRLMVLDADSETFSRHATPIQGVADVLDKAMLRIAGATNIPVSILFGQDPAGLNASGDLQIRRFYDFVQNAQETELRPKQSRLIRLIFVAKDGPTGGLEPENWSLSYNGLTRLNDHEKADLRLKTTQADTMEINNGTLLVDEVALARHTTNGYSAGEIQIDRELRADLLEADKEKARNPPPPPTFGAPPPDDDEADDSDDDSDDEAEEIDTPDDA